MARVINDFGKRIKLHTAVNMIRKYRTAKLLGYTERQAAQYAMADTISTQWHKHGVILPDSPEKAAGFKWFRGTTTTDCSMERFLHLLGTAAIGLPDYIRDGAGPNILEYSPVREWVQNYTAVTGAQVDPLDFYQIPALASWEGIKRLRDLRIKGWGKGNFEAAFDTGYICATDLVAVAYRFPRSFRFRQFVKNKKLVRWVAKYRDYWFGADHNTEGQRWRNRIDEVMMSVKTVKVHEMHPRQFFEWAAIEYSRCNYGEQLDEKDVRYDWLDGIASLHIPATKGTLAPIRSRHELIKVATDLHNCAASYDIHIQMKECILVVMRDAMGHPQALAEVTIDRGKPSDEVAQISGYNNESVTTETLFRFQEYIRTFLQPVTFK